MSVAVGSSPQAVDCPHCHAAGTTTVAYENGTLVWLLVGVCVVLGFFLLIPWCLCWIPCVVDGCKDAVHTCPSCRAVVGRYKRL